MVATVPVLFPLPLRHHDRPEPFVFRTFPARSIGGGGDTVRWLERAVIGSEPVPLCQRCTAKGRSTMW